jgi:hypothetical protein
MEYVQPDLELALLHLKQLEHRIAEQRARVARLREIGASTETAEQFLAVLRESVDLVKTHIGRITSIDVNERSSQPADAFSIPPRDRS